MSSNNLDAINNKKELIKVNIHYGNPIAKNLIPEATLLFTLTVGICSRLD